METESLTMDPEEQELRDMGHEADMAEGRPIPKEPSATPAEPRAPAEEEIETQQPQPPETERSEQPKPESSETESKQEPQQPIKDPVTGKFVKQKPDTEYSRAVKEKERQDRSWTKLQAEKEQFRLQQTQWQEEQRMAELESARQNYQPLQKDGLTAKEYYDGGMAFEQSGDFEHALAAYKTASELSRAEQERYAKMRDVEAEYQWRKGVQEMAATNPEIWKTGSPVQAHLHRLIESHGEWFYRMPQGFHRAVEIAEMLAKMDLISELQDEVEQLRAEREQHWKKSQPAKGGFTTPRLGEKDFDEMSLDEMEAHLKGVTAEADNYRG
jgi:hypothetical protein